MDYILIIATIIGLNIILALGLNIIWGYAGQPHLGVNIYTSIGAYSAALLLTKAGLPFFLVMLVSIALAIAFAVLTGLPSLRVGSDFLAITTIGLAFVVESLYAYLPQDWLGGPLGILDIPKPFIFGYKLSITAFFVVVLFFAGFLTMVKWKLVKSWLGLTWESIREDELASRVMGINVAKFKIIAFAIGGGYCGLAGFLYAQFMGSVSPTDFGFLPSLSIVAMIMLGGVGTIRGPIVGAIILTALPELFRFVQEYRNLIYGSLLVLVMSYQHSGLLGKNSFLGRNLHSLVQRWRRKASVKKTVSYQELVLRENREKPSSLAIRSVSINFGGLRALENVTLEVNPGEIVGIIGPNGAGKTTLFNIISGLYHPETGGVFLNASPIHRLRPDLIAKKGIGRTFQVVRPFQNLSVLQNVLVPYGAKCFSSPRKLFKSYSGGGILVFADRMVHLLGLEKYRDEQARTLPLGLLRRLEIARSLSLGAQFLLLDEPFSGLSVEESHDLKELILSLKEQGKAILLIEHNMKIAMEVCDRVVVLNFGQKIAEGPPAQVCADPLVIEAYLGKED